ncbi:MAG: PEP-CTERM sorting domain-containing protein [Parvularculaceae bacterium]
MGFVKSIIVGLAIATLWQAPAQANTSLFNVRDTGGNWLGGMTTISEARSAVDYYSLSSWSAHPGFNLNANGMHMFLHEDTTTGVFSLGVVLDRISDGSAGRLNGSLSGLGAGASVALSDDAGEATIISPGTASFNFRWFNCCTDGFVISGVDPNNLSLVFNVLSSNGLTDLYFVNGNGSMTSSPISNGTFSFSVSSAPEPSTWGLMIFGFIGMAVRLKAQKSASQRDAFPGQPVGC